MGLQQDTPSLFVTCVGLDNRPGFFSGQGRYQRANYVTLQLVECGFVFSSRPNFVGSLFPDEIGHKVAVYVAKTQKRPILSHVRPVL